MVVEGSYSINEDVFLLEKYHISYNIVYDKILTTRSLFKKYELLQQWNPYPVSQYSD
jgi:hypothetical protein